MKINSGPYARGASCGRLLVFFAFVVSVPVLALEGTDHRDDRIQVFPENPHYLSWGGTPIFPLGPTGRHSWTPISRPGTMDFEAQLNRVGDIFDRIASPHVVGFVRCLPYDPMNHIHDGEVERVLQPWVQLEDGRYDLERFAPEWEDRLHAYLALALERRIVVSLEVWDDWSVTRGPNGAYDPGEGVGWNAHAFNPNNNVNYDEDVLPASTARCDAPFYATIPGRSYVEEVLDLQKLYVDRLLDIASEYPNVLINISNESRAHLDWSRFWAEYVRERVPAGAMIGEMPSTNRVDGGGECEHEFNPLTLATDPRYDFVDVAQGVSGHEFGGSAREQALGGGGRMKLYRQAMAEAETRRPLIVSKDYTRDRQGGEIVLWSRFAGGAATARFHRLAHDHPDAVSDFQHEAVERLGQFLARVPFWKMHPAHEVVIELPGEAGGNVLAEPDGETVIQLLGARKGQILSLELAPGDWVVEWLNPAVERVHSVSFEITIENTPWDFEVPGDLDHWILHLKKQEG